MKNYTGHNAPIDLIALHLSGNASPEELQALENWLQENNKNRELFDQYAALWKKTGSLKQIEAIDLEREWERFTGATAINKPAGKSRVMQMAVRLLAAIFTGAIIGLSGLLMYRSTQFEKVTSRAEVKEIVLPDGSSVTLNAGSVLKYHKNFGERSRDLKLKGEAYFDVVKDSIKPFTVEVSEIIVKVLGTSFNVDASDNDKLTLIVAGGRVALYGKNGRDLSGVLVKGEKVTVDTKTSALSKGINKNPNFDSYKTKRIVFNNTGIEELAQTIRKVYNVDIMLESTGLSHKRITVTFDNKELDYVLKTIEATLDLELERRGRVIIIK